MIPRKQLGAEMVDLGGDGGGSQSEVVELCAGERRIESGDFGQQPTSVEDEFAEIVLAAQPLSREDRFRKSARATPITWGRLVPIDYVGLWMRSDVLPHRCHRPGKQVADRANDGDERGGARLDCARGRRGHLLSGAYDRDLRGRLPGQRGEKTGPPCFGAVGNNNHDRERVRIAHFLSPRLKSLLAKTSGARTRVPTRQVVELFTRAIWSRRTLPFP
jgi:hypothetical protein